MIYRLPEGVIPAPATLSGINSKIIFPNLIDLTAY
jgi:hypothetical protein